MPVRTSPSDGTSRWVTNLSGAGTRISAGVDAVSRAPGLAAADKFQKWVAAMQDPNVQAKWRNNVAAVSLSQWQDLMKKVGVPRIAAGAQAKQSKYLAFAEQFYPFLARGVQQIQSMDDTSFEARIQRAVAMMNYTHTFKRAASSGA